MGGLQRALSTGVDYAGYRAYAEDGHSNYIRGPIIMRELLKLGASGYVSKGPSAAHLAGAIRAVVFAPGEDVVVGMPRGRSSERSGSP